MSFFRPRPRQTEIPLEVVALFMGQLVEMMKHTEDSIDMEAKKYALDVLKELGIPTCPAVGIEEETLEIEEEQEECLPIIHRNK